MTTNARRKAPLCSAILATLGCSLAPHPAIAELITFSWSGQFSLLDPNGALIANTSLSSKSNQYVTPVSGTLMLDNHTGAGSVTVAPFHFFANPNPVVFSEFSLQAVGDGSGGASPLVLGNAVAAWGGYTGIPASFVFDASGLFSRIQALQIGDVVSGIGVRPAVDGTYISSYLSFYPEITDGYLDIGPVPIATTKWNVTPTCTPGGGNTGACVNDAHSGALPLIEDTLWNPFDYDTFFMGGDNSYDVGMAGSPLLAGPFENYSPNLNFTSLTVIDVAAVPAPAAAGLFISGIAGLYCAARRRRAGPNAEAAESIAEQGRRVTG